MTAANLKIVAGGKESAGQEYGEPGTVSDGGGNLEDMASVPARHRQEQPGVRKGETQTECGRVPWWAAGAVWGVVNAVNVLQAAGFLSRIPAGSTAVNRRLGYLILVLAAPAAAALVAFVRAGSDWLHRAGPISFLWFAALMAVVDYIRPVEFRSPARLEILIPYLLLFFGSILLMGLPMFRLNRRLWLVTVGTTILLLAAMGAAMFKGVA